MNVKFKYSVDARVYWSEPASRILHSGKVVAISIGCSGPMYRVTSVNMREIDDSCWFPSHTLTTNVFELPENELFNSEKLLVTKGRRLILEHHLAWQERRTSALKMLLEKHKKHRASLLWELECLDKDIKIEETSLTKDRVQISKLKKELRKEK